MDTFEEIIKNQFGDADVSPNPPTKQTIESAEEAVGFRFGAMLKSYLMSFGYLGHGAVELYGINEVQKCQSDMVKTTLNIREYHKGCEGYVVVDNLGDGQYILCDQKDMVYELPEDDNTPPVSMNMNFMQYVVKRFSEA